MKVLALAAYGDHAAATRFRISAYRDDLASQNIDVQIISFADQARARSLQESGSPAKRSHLLLERIPRWLAELRNAEPHDVVWIQREAALLGPPIVELILGWLGAKPIVYDMDDAVWLTPPVTPGTPRAKLGPVADIIRWPWKAQAILPRTAAVIAGSHYLADYARRYCGNVFVVPTGVSAKTWTPRSSRRACGRLVVGWIGTPSTAAFLPEIFAPLQRLKAAGLDFVFRVRGAGPDFTVPGIETESLPWRADHEAADFAAIDVGVAPMPRTRWTAGKCGFKQIQYMAAGVPFVCSRVGPALEIVEDGVTGFTAEGEDEWYERLQSLATEPELRQRMTKAGRAHFETNYATEALGSTVAAALCSATGRDGRRGTRDERRSALDPTPP